MAFNIWSQSNFSKGELSPYMYARSDVVQYFTGLKRAQNVLTYPSGAAGKRFGTYFDVDLSGLTSRKEFFFDAFQYADECTYQVLFYPGGAVNGAISVYLEPGQGVVTLSGTGFNGETNYNLNATVIGTAFRVAGETIGKPKELTRASDPANIIVSVQAAPDNTFTLTNALTLAIGTILPFKIATAGTKPTTIPAINVGITYFLKIITANTVAMFSNSRDAYLGIHKYILVDNGVGVNTIFIQNTWSFADCVFKNLPIYDFDGGYDAITFTPSAITGAAINLTASTKIFTANMVGGAFIGGGGSSRIMSITSPTIAVIAVSKSFDSIVGIQGALCYLAEPAWSDDRGWPTKCSSYQNRALFANTKSLPNGFWASAINDYTDFNDLDSDDDDAISWFPTSSDINFIRFIVPYRSLTVHTNSGVYSSPLSEISAITPKTFSLQLQDSTPADVLQPRAIDNQIIVLSGNDVHTMLWDGINNAYTSDIVSVVSEQVIRDPVDETVFADLSRAGSRYVLIINDAGSMAIYQTLISQNVGGFTPAILEQSYGNAGFLQSCSDTNGRCWFVTERQIAVQNGTTPITAFETDILTAVGSNLSLNIATAILFTTAGTLPTTTPALQLNTYYWAVGVTLNTFKVYVSKDDAESNSNAFIFSNFGTTANVIDFPLQTRFYKEELQQDVKLDCVVYAISFVGASSFNTGPLFNAQAVKMLGDGFGYNAIGVNNTVDFKAHGMPTDVNEAYIGFPINCIIEPMPLTSTTSYNQSPASLTRPKHIRSVSFMFNNTIGGTINGVDIALNQFDEIIPGNPPIPSRGIFEMSIAKGWDDFNNPTFILEHNEPYNIELLGAFYLLDT